MNILEKIKTNYSASMNEMTVAAYLEECKKDPKVYAKPAERILDAIGEPEILDTRQDPVLSRIFSNKRIKIYPAFKDFYGMESTIEQIVSYFRHSAQGLEEKKQILYLMGPVGGGKSSLAEKLKHLMQQHPIYVLKAGDQVSPVFESPLGLFADYTEELEAEYNIPARYVPGCMSPWASKRLREFDGDINRFKVIRLFPSIQEQVAISKTEPGDENNQDISTLVGKVDIRKLAEYQQSDPDAYSYTGGLCLANQGLLEFVEMFKAPIKVLNPLLTATQEKNYKGTEPIGAIPFDGIILAHSNESEWAKFLNDKKNEAFLDRIYKVQVPYCLRVSEEIKIYEKLIRESSLKDAPCAPKTIELLAEFSVMSRLKEPENSHIYSKMRVYNGETLRETDPNAKSIQEYRDDAGINEGMQGISTRFAFKILSKVFNFDSEEIAANPVHLLYVLEQEVIKMMLPPETETKYLHLIKSVLVSKYAEFISDEIQKAYIESYSSYGQNIFEKYVVYADHWMQNNDYRDPDSGEIFDRSILNDELEKIEKPAGIANPKDFRAEVTNFFLRHKANHGGKSPRWDSYEKIKNVIEKKIFTNTEDLLPVVTFTVKTNEEDEKKHRDFTKRMKQRGYTEKQIRILVDWFMRVRKTMA
ncbi:PrkA family serine protein kinase [Pontibacter beigongshangensis]|uniref:PrkA family serine protein kinase n=1 Tax=Pontibacter beigongshangensis TaxID=2574733 RepID=UPI00164F7965|nr:PrkA family serine protein kinase [Pontibacter beigongshangensis]